MDTMSRPPELHVSALSDAEHEHYSRALAAVANVRVEDYLSVTEVKAVDVRRYIAGHYVVEDEDVEKMLRIFHPTASWSDALSPSQFFAVLRLVSHAQRGRAVDRKLIFSQTPPPIAIDTPTLSAATPPKADPADPSPAPRPPLPPPKHISLTSKPEPASSPSQPKRPFPPKPATSSTAVRPPSPSKRAPPPMPSESQLPPLPPPRSPSPNKKFPPPRLRSATTTPTTTKPLPPDPIPVPVPPPLPTSSRSTSPTRPTSHPPARQNSNPFRRASSHHSSSSTVEGSNPFRTSASVPSLPSTSPPPPPLPRRPSTTSKPPLPPRTPSVFSSPSPSLKPKPPFASTSTASTPTVTATARPASFTSLPTPKPPSTTPSTLPTPLIPTLPTPLTPTLPTPPTPSATQFAPPKPPKPTFAVSPLIREGLLAAKATRIIEDARPEKHHVLEVIRTSSNPASSRGVGSGPAQEKEQDEDDTSSAESLDSDEVRANLAAAKGTSPRAQSFTGPIGQRTNTNTTRLPPPRRRPESVQLLPTNTSHSSPFSTPSIHTRAATSPPKRLARAPSLSLSSAGGGGPPPPPYQPPGAQSGGAGAAFASVLAQTKEAFAPVGLEIERLKRSSMGLSRGSGIGVGNSWGRRVQGEERLVDDDPLVDGGGYRYRDLEGDDGNGGAGMDEGEGEGEGDVFADPGGREEKEWERRVRGLERDEMGRVGGEGWRRLG